MSAMFPCLILYRMHASIPLTLDSVEEALQKTPFTPCGATQEKSIGWTPARNEENGALCESVGGQWIMRFHVETKQLPASVLNRKVQEKADAIEKEFGRKPGKKEKKDLKDEARLDLLPMAFTKTSTTYVWIDPENRLLAIGSAAQSRADEIVTLLVEGIKGLGVALVDTQSSAQACMAHWLISQEPPAGFSIDRSVVLKAADESKAVVRYTNHALDIAEVKEHVEQGKLPLQLAMTWDDRVSFVLTDSLTIKGIELLDGVLDSVSKDDKGFDTDVAIFTGEFVKFIPDLLVVLGGEGRTSAGSVSTEVSNASSDQ